VAQVYKANGVQRGRTHTCKQTCMHRSGRVMKISTGGSPVALLLFILIYLCVGVQFSFFIVHPSRLY